MGSFSGSAAFTLPLLSQGSPVCISRRGTRNGAGSNSFTYCAVSCLPFGCPPSDSLVRDAVYHHRQKKQNQRNQGQYKYFGSQRFHSAPVQETCHTKNTAVRKKYYLLCIFNRNNILMNFNTIQAAVFCNLSHLCNHIPFFCMFTIIRNDTDTKGKPGHLRPLSLRFLIFKKSTTAESR